MAGHRRRCVTRFSHPGPIWDGYLGGEIPVRAGAEHRRGAFFTDGAHASFNERGLDFADGEIRFWVRPTWGYEESSGQSHYVLLWAPEAWTDDLRVFVWNRRTLAPRLTVGGETFSVNHDIEGWQPHVWHHVRIELEGGSTVRLHVDGEPVAERTGVPLGALAPRRARLVVGGAGTRNTFEGVIDELVVR